MYHTLSNETQRAPPRKLPFSCSYSYIIAPTSPGCCCILFIATCHCRLWDTASVFFSIVRLYVNVLKCCISFHLTFLRLWFQNETETSKKLHTYRLLLDYIKLIPRDSLECQRVLLLWLNNRCRSRPACTTYGLGFQWLIDSPHSRIVSPTYGGAVYFGIEPMTGMLLSRTSWRLYNETGSSKG